MVAPGSGDPVLLAPAEPVTPLAALTGCVQVAAAMCGRTRCKRGGDFGYPFQLTRPSRQYREDEALIAPETLNARSPHAVHRIVMSQHLHKKRGRVSPALSNLLT